MIYKIALASMRGITVKVAQAIIDRFDDLSLFFSLSRQQLAEAFGSDSRLFADEPRAKALAEASREMEFVTKNAIRLIFFTDASYPRRLIECEDAPLLLYGIGTTDLNNARFISIVGTRHATAYGIRFVDDLIPSLASTMADPIVVVSGLAYGIDVAAHRSALSASVPTIGVLAHGLNTIYPAAHRDTASRMIRAGGALLTDYRSIDAIHKGNFLARNRIVAGLSDCVIVVESDSRGGAMSTARLAAAYSRDVFSLPGRYTDRFSRGCNSLIASHIAQIVTEPDDIIQAMNWKKRPENGSQPSLPLDLNPDEEAIISLLTTNGQASLSEILEVIDLPVHRLMSLLIDMESRSLLIALPGANYRPL